MRVIGITGGIGSGKSKVLSILEKHGVTIINADIIAREIVKKGEKAYFEIVNHFGDRVLNSDREINRKKLGQIVFSEEKELITLNNITHAIIGQKIKKKLKGFSEKSVELVAIEAAIPIKEGFLDIVDEVWVVTLDLESKLDRIMKRDSISREEALKRIAFQSKEYYYLQLSNKIINNSGNLASLVKQVLTLLKN